MEKEEPDEDEEIYVIEPKPEPKFRRQIFRDKDRVIFWQISSQTNKKFWL